MASPGCPSGSRGSPPWPWRSRVGAWPISTGCTRALPHAPTGPKLEHAGLPEEHQRPDYAHVYIDDTGGVAPKDLVLRSAWPKWLQEVDLGEEVRPEDGLMETSAAAGSRPERPWQAAADIAKGASGHPEARFAIHARIAVGTFRELGFEVSAA